MPLLPMRYFADDALICRAAIRHDAASALMLDAAAADDTLLERQAPLMSC